VQDVATADVVVAARDGDQAAWRELVRRHARMVWGVARSYRLSAQDAEDVSQTAWLLLATHLQSIEDPAAVGGWLATTTRRESLRLLRRRGREVPSDLLDAAERADVGAEAGEEAVLRAERRAQVRSAFAELSEPCQRLLDLLMRDPPLSYDEISSRLGLRRGSIGPTRGRCLDRLREILGPALYR
jgi:RNA polymerase sigma factor (sigma-70 family)